MPKILFVYTGFEQGTWGDIAFRKEKFYHYLPGIVYLAAAVRASSRTAGYEVQTRHFNASVQSEDEIVNEIAAFAPGCVGFGCYCWNLELHLRVISALKQRMPNVRIVLGGPEILMKGEEECAAFFVKAPGVDLLVFGEAETRIARLLGALLDGSEIGVGDLTGYCFNPRHGYSSRPEPGAAACLDEIPSIYPHEISVKRSPGCGLYVVYEGSRGCPNRCIYCEFTRWRKTQDQFPFDRVERELTWLLESQVDGIHFADAMFDRDPSLAKRILRLIVQRQRSSSVLCYCSFNTLDEELVELFERCQCQIGVGVQSVNHDVLRALRRYEPAKLFSGGAEMLKGRAVNWYVDLMFGLPEDTMDSFRVSFDKAARLRPGFVMLFPLTLIKGTTLGDAPHVHEVVAYPPESLTSLDLQCDIEYRHIGMYRAFTAHDLERFDSAALTCFYYYNRYPYSLGHLQNRWDGNLFDLYEKLGRKTKDYFRRGGARPSNSEYAEEFPEEIKRIFVGTLREMGAGECEARAFEDLLKLDLYRTVLLRAPQREKTMRACAAAGQVLDVPKTLSDTMRIVRSSYGTGLSLEFPLDELMRLHELREAATPRISQVFMHAPYERADAVLMPFTGDLKFVLEAIPAGRPIPYKAVNAAFEQHARRQPAARETLPDLLGQLARLGVIRVVT